MRRKYKNLIQGIKYLTVSIILENSTSQYSDTKDCHSNLFKNILSRKKEILALKFYIHRRLIRQVRHIRSFMCGFINN